MYNFFITIAFVYMQEQLNHAELGGPYRSGNDGYAVEYGQVAETKQ